MTGRPPWRRWAALLAVGLALAAALPAPARGHGGPPLRIGVTASPELDALGRLLLAHLRDGVGYAVAWEAFADEAALAAALAAGKVDVAPACCPAEDRAAAPGATLFPLPFAPGGASACARLCVAANPRSLAELRFTILGDEIRKLVAALAPADLAAVRAARASGGERAAAAAARAAVAGKRLP